MLLSLELLGVTQKPSQALRIFKRARAHAPTVMAKHAWERSCLLPAGKHVLPRLQPELMADVGRHERL